MRIWWISEVQQHKNACRLFFCRKKAVKQIIKEMEEEGYTVTRVDVQPPRSATFAYFMNEAGEKLVWSFIPIHIE
jgi:hypothetical protein